ncbi:MAG TPA: DNA alkylation repair protein [Gemmatimonas sp.]|uniref:DNA alkylation repair protein n=1 Tax=Gemmatimonas sp. TaxID=1962908 RepID=UPI002ED86A4D
MAEPFKNFISAELVQSAANHLQRTDARFKAKPFVARVVPQLDALELKARAMCVADALSDALPPDFDDAATLLERALAPVGVREDAPAMHLAKTGLSGWFLWSVGEYAARRGVEHPERALAFLHALTQRFTAEFAIRAIIVAHPELAYRTLATWAHDDSEHVRRLVSEGTRPRLPWGLQLRALIADPSPSLPLLEVLLDDRSEYVRRSVANHLNDIAKDHPALVAEWVERHLPGASHQRRALLKHACRTLIKKGDARILDAWGLGARFKGSAVLSLAPRRITLGGSTQLTLELTSSAKQAQSLVIDYVVHHVKADGSTSPKVFKGWSLTLPPRGARTLTRKHTVKPITTRRYYAGVHRVEVQINGTVVAEAEFRLSL